MTSHLRTLLWATVAFGMAICLPALAQDAARPTSRGTGYSVGITCPTGQVMTITGNSGFSCANRVANADAADTATTAATATTATTATSAVSASSLSGTINASQLTGTLASGQIAGAMPNCSSGQVLTQSGGTFSCVTPTSSGGGGGSGSLAGCTGTYNGAFYANGTTQTISYGCGDGNSCYTTQTCNNGTWQ